MTRLEEAERLVKLRRYAERRADTAKAERDRYGSMNRLEQGMSFLYATLPWEEATIVSIAIPSCV